MTETVPVFEFVSHTGKYRGISIMKLYFIIHYRFPHPLITRYGYPLFYIFILQLVIFLHRKQLYHVPVIRLSVKAGHRLER